jgi:predicted MFS family arabinose efflux permease
VSTIPATAPPRFHYAWVVAGVSFFVLLTVAGVRSAAGIILLPLAKDTGWSIATISLAVAINVALYGAMGPFAAALMQRFGLRRTMLAALAVITVSTAATSRIATPLQLDLTWGIGVGLGVGTTGMVLASVVATRWFAARRGMVVGAMTGATATGQLIFLPLLAFVADRFGWRPVGLVVSVVAVLVAIPVILFMRDRPEDVGVRPYGATPENETTAAELAADRGNPLANVFRVLGRAVRNRNFVLISTTFFVCGASTNGFIATHWIAACGDHGIPQVKAAGLLASMGVFSLIGTTASGWLSDRYSSRALLFFFYGSRGIALLAVPSLLDANNQWLLPLFMMFYGLDWLATAAPNLRVLTEALGRADAPIAFGWCGVVHQMGAGTIAFLAGTIRTDTQSYNAAFAFSGTLCFVAALAVLFLAGRTAKPSQPVPRLLPIPAP